MQDSALWINNWFLFICTGFNQSLEKVFGSPPHSKMLFRTLLGAAKNSVQILYIRILGGCCIPFGAHFLQEGGDGEVPLWAGESPPSTFKGQGGEWVTEALLPGGLRSEQQDGPNTHPSISSRSYCLRKNQVWGLLWDLGGVWRWWAVRGIIYVW